MQTDYNPGPRLCISLEHIYNLAMLRSGLLSLSIVGVLAACGGPPKSAPPLEKRVKSQYLDPIPTNDRIGLADAAREVYMAQAAIAYYEAALVDAKVEEKVASNEEKKAKLSQESAKVRSERDKDLMKVDKAKAGMSMANMNLSVAAAKRDHRKAHKDFLEAEILARKTELRSAEARLEYLKAKALADAKIKPPGSKLSDYKSQYKSRAGKAKSARAQADSRKKVLAQRTTNLEKLTGKVDAKKRALIEASKPPPPPPPPTTPEALPAVTTEIDNAADTASNTPETKEPPTVTEKPPAETTATEKPETKEDPKPKPTPAPEPKTESASPEAAPEKKEASE
jgi:hypothetical protein